MTAARWTRRVGGRTLAPMRHTLLSGSGLAVFVVLVFAGVAQAQTSETLTLPGTVGSASSAPSPKAVTTTKEFLPGKATIFISGVVNVWPSNAQYSPFNQDAVYCFDGCARFNNSPSSETPRVSPLISYQLPGGGWAQYGHVGPEQWLAYEGGHVYAFPVTLTAKGHISFAFQDTQPDDNTGAFTIRIESEEPRPKRPAEPPPATSCDKPVGRVIKLDGDANLLLPGADWRELHVGQALCAADEVHTGPDSSVDIQFSNGGVVHLHELTRIRVGGFSNPNTRVQNELLLKIGELKAKVKPQEVIRSGFSVRTPTATASVRGTVFTVAYDPGTKRTTVATAEGKVEVDPTGAGTTTMVSAGQAVDVTRTGVTPVAKKQLAARTKARHLVLKKITNAQKRCKLTLAPYAENAISVTPAGKNFNVKARTTKGASTWKVAGSKVTPTNPLANRIAADCR